MPEPDLIELFARPLHSAGMRYLVTGSVGAMLYSEPRLTLDIDLAVSLPSKHLAQLPVIFREPDFYCPPMEVLEAESKRECRAHYNILHVPSGLKADCYPPGGDAFFTWAWEHRRTADFPSGPVFYAPPEYVIVWKVAYFAEGGGEKHVRDLKRIFDLSGEEIDRDIVKAELARRGLDSKLEEILGCPW